MEEQNKEFPESDLDLVNAQRFLTKQLTKLSESELNDPKIGGVVMNGIRQIEKELKIRKSE